MTVFLAVLIHADICRSFSRDIDPDAGHSNPTHTPPRSWPRSNSNTSSACPVSHCTAGLKPHSNNAATKNSTPCHPESSRDRPHHSPRSQSSPSSIHICPAPYMQCASLMTSCPSPPAHHATISCRVQSVVPTIGRISHVIVTSPPASHFPIAYIPSSAPNSLNFIDFTIRFLNINRIRFPFNFPRSTVRLAAPFTPHSFDVDVIITVARPSRTSVESSPPKKFLSLPYARKTAQLNIAKRLLHHPPAASTEPPTHIERRSSQRLTRRMLHETNMTSHKLLASK